MRRIRWGASAVVLALALAVTVPAEAKAADEITCAGHYLLCLNAASGLQQYATSQSGTCLLKYYACLRREALGS